MSPVKKVCLVFSLLITVLHSIQGVYYDMSEGDPGMITPCPPGLPLIGKWREEDASLYETTESGPLDGLVLTSEFKTRSCLRSPELFTAQQNFTFQINVYLPKADIGAKTRKFQVWLIENDEGEYIIHEERGPSEAGWYLIDAPMPTKPGIIYPNPYNVEIWVTADVDFAAIRWFGLSDSPLPPPEPTTTESPTTETTEFTTEETTVESTTEEATTTDEPETTEEPSTTEESTTTESTTSTTELTTPTTTKKTTTTTSTTAKPTTSTTSKSTPSTTSKSTPSTTATSPLPTQVPSETPCTGTFPDLWSLLLGIALGILFMSLMFFLLVCCGWFCTTRRKKEFFDDQPPTLPRLEVVSTSSQFGSQKSITGSWLVRESRKTEPSWYKRK